MREDIFFVEEERNETARRLDEVDSELERVSKECDSLAERKVADEARNKDEQIEELRDEVNTTRAGLADLQAQHDRQEVKIVHLQEARKHWEREVKALTVRNESLKNELDSSKRALRDIRTVAVRTTGRVRERYSGA